MWVLFPSLSGTLGSFLLVRVLCIAVPISLWSLRFLSSSQGFYVLLFLFLCGALAFFPPHKGSVWCCSLIFAFNIPPVSWGT